MWGVPRYHVHQCFHALAWGPEGDLYISMGDTLVHYGDFERPDHWGHWTFFTPAVKEGIPYTGQGAVLRMHPDGSGLQVVARGFRNCCGLVFDKSWNLFGNDNDHESLPLAYVPGRLLHVTPHSDFAWPRGWMPQITPDRADLLETMFTGMGRAVPVGQAYLDSPNIPEKFRHNLLVARWGVRALMRYPISPRGGVSAPLRFRSWLARTRHAPSASRSTLMAEFTSRLPTWLTTTVRRFMPATWPG